MLGEVDVWLPQISRVLYEQGLVDIDPLLASWPILLDIGCIFGYVWPVISFPLHAPVEAYIVVDTSRAKDTLEFYLHPPICSSQNTSITSKL